MNSSPPILESFIHANYPGLNLPPLWAVIYQEAIRGHHLLFRRADVERFDQDTTTTEWADAVVSEEIELVAMSVIACADLQAMVKIIDSLAVSRRRDLYNMYKRVLWMWRNYVKDQMN